MSTRAKRDEGRRFALRAVRPWLVLGSALLAVALLCFAYLRPSFARDYGKSIRFHGAMFGRAIEQPVSFSHRLHATDQQIACRYCHPYVDRGSSAGLPSIQKCLGCHDHMAGEPVEIAKLRGYRDRGEELGWVRVYYSPDHVSFPHDRHVLGGSACAECHGELERVDRLHKATFYMGFCIDCHTERQATRDCAACHR